MNLKLLDNYIVPAKVGREAFEREYETVEVIFQRKDGSFLLWNEDPFEPFEDNWRECTALPSDMDMQYIKEEYFNLDDLAKQMGFAHAWGMDH